MIDLRIEGSGFAELERDLEHLGLELDTLRGAYTDIAEFGARLAARFAPRRTGRLAGSLQAVHARGYASVRSDLPYAGVINYGWRRRNIRPSYFMQRASSLLGPFAEARIDLGIEALIREKGLG